MSLSPTHTHTFGQPAGGLVQLGGSRIVQSCLYIMESMIDSGDGVEVDEELLLVCCIQVPKISISHYAERQLVII